MLEVVWRVLGKVHQWVLMTMVVLIGLATALLGTVGTVLYLWDRENDTIVQSVQDAGLVRMVTLVPGLAIHSVVETDAGFYALRTGVSLLKGEAVTIEVRANARRYLCDGQRRCVELL